MSGHRVDDWGWRWARNLEINEEERNRKERAEKLARRNRWAFPGKVRVVHPKYGEVIVPGESPYAAILCAAEKWKCDSAEIMDARVMAVEETKKEQPTRAGVDCGR